MIKQRYEFTKKLIKNAGAFLLEHKAERVNITAKSSNDYVTEADKKCEALIVSAIKKEYPEDGFYCEESGKENSKTPWGNGFKFLIEYNFAHSGSSPYLPTVGGYWKHMPRGNSTYDNQLCIYVCSNF